jgi:uncharacterized membrane protein YoaK (UPF0700 family)
MIRHIPPWILRGSVILAFCAGLVNSVALLGFANNAVSHITGTVTLAASALTDTDFEVAIRTTLIVLAFLAGAIVSGFIVKNESLALGRRYGVAMILESVLLTLATVLFWQRSFGGELLASAACGLQNAMVATYSGSIIRTTHLTGILSDIGAAIGNMLAGRPFHALQVRLQAAIFLSFALGAAVGSVLFTKLGYSALLVPASAILLAAIVYQFSYKDFNKDL